MKQRDLIILLKSKSNTVYYATDRINNYQYQIEIVESENLGKWISIRQRDNRFSESICMFLENKTTEIDDFYHSRDYVEYEYPIFRCMAGVGGLSIHSKEHQSFIYELVLLPRGSYKIFEQLIKLNN